MNPEQIAEYKRSIEKFSIGVYEHYNGMKFIKAYHHSKICEYLEAIVIGEIQNLVINVAPRHGKTDLSLVHFVAWTLGLFPDSEYIHTSYTAKVAFKNSGLARSLVCSDFYKQIFPHVQLDSSTKAKNEWRTTKGGIMYAAGSEGSITSFGAGKMREDGMFGGALIMDDPHKPNEAESETTRVNVIDTYMNTIRNRINHPKTPKILIMQRVHEEDLAGFVLDGGDGEYWEHLKLASIREDGTALWSFKHSIEQLKQMEANDPYNFASQHMQDPTPKGGAMFKSEWWKRYPAAPPTPEYYIMTCDTAQRTGQHNDYSVVQLWSFWSNKAYLIDQIRGKWEPEDLENNIVNFWKSHTTEKNIRAFYMEDASSGTRLIDTLPTEHGIPIVPIKRKKDKFARACDVINYVASGMVYIPEKSEWVEDFLSEMSRFSPVDTHKHDDQVDCAVDAIDILMNPPEIYCGVLTAS